MNYNRSVDSDSCRRCELFLIITDHDSETAANLIQKKKWQLTIMLHEEEQITIAWSQIICDTDDDPGVCRVYNVSLAAAPDNFR